VHGTRKAERDQANLCFPERFLQWRGKSAKRRGRGCCGPKNVVTEIGHTLPEMSACYP